MKADINMYSYKKASGSVSVKGGVVRYNNVIPCVLLYHPDIEEFYLQDRRNTRILGQGLYDKCLDMTVMSPEELFQYSLVWEFVHDIYLVKAMQVMFKANVKRFFKNEVMQIEY